MPILRVAVDFVYKLTLARAIKSDLLRCCLVQCLDKQQQQPPAFPCQNSVQQLSGIVTDFIGKVQIVGL